MPYKVESWDRSRLEGIIGEIGHSSPSSLIGTGGVTERPSTIVVDRVVREPHNPTLYEA